MRDMTRWKGRHAMAALGFAGLLVAVPVQAGGSGSTASQTSGTVEKLDRTSGEITLAESRETLVVTDATEIRKDGRRATLSDVREGDEVRASYSGSGGALQVTMLDVSAGDPFREPWRDRYYHPSHDSP